MNTTIENKPSKQGLTFGHVLWMFLGAIGGIGAAYYLLPIWQPGISASIIGTDVKMFWFLSRASAIIAYIFLWLSMMMGLMFTTRMGKLWPGLAITSEMHKFVSLLGIGFAVFHGLILMGDSYLQPTLGQVLLPFNNFPYRPEMVIWGQFALIFWAILIGSFYIRKLIGRKTWRVLHFTSFLMFLFAMIHGIGSGTDTGTTAMQAVYWTSAGSVLFMILYRIFTALLGDDPIVSSGKDVISEK